MKRKYGYYLSVIITGGLLTATSCEKELFTHAGTVNDIDGNTYNVIRIGKQSWFGENLKTSKYNNGNPIPNVTDGFQWTNLKTAAYCYYDNSITNHNIYGNLYNWYSVNTGNLCPTGWHVPSAAEWKTLEEFLGRAYDAGGRLKEEGTKHWAPPNFGGINSSGFTALPAGFFSTCWVCGDLSSSQSINYSTGFWSSTGVDSQTAVERFLISDDHILGSFNEPKYSGLSVRCLKDK